jgi:hypothetical protein
MQLIAQLLLYLDPLTAGGTMFDVRGDICAKPALSQGTQRT